MDGTYTNISSLVKDITYSLLPTYHDNSVANAQAWFILEHVTGKRKVQFISNPFIIISPEQKKQLEMIVDKIKRVGIPFVYAIGSASFLGLELSIKPPVLIPRPETESWCAQVIGFIEGFIDAATPDKPFRVLDMCTGSGCIALALAVQFHDKHIAILGIDNSSNALDCAQLNAEKYNITSCTFMRSDLYSQLPSDYACDLIVTNPPYVKQNEFATLDPAVRYWEDYHALVGGPRGTEIIEHLVAYAAQYLRPDYGCAQMWCEIGHQQGQLVTPFFAQAGFNNIEVMKDIRRRDRVVRATAPCIKKG